MLIPIAPRKPGGFTIVELLVIIVVIGILFAIGVVSYSAFATNSRIGTTKKDLNDIGRILTTYKAKTGAYPSSAEQLTGAYSVKLTKNVFKTEIPYNLTYCLDSTGRSYALLAVTRDGKKVQITNASSADEYKGASDWTTNDRTAHCTSVLPSSTPRMSGYESSTWQPWVGTA